MQAILITSSLLLVLAMLGSLAWLPALRAQIVEPEPVAVEPQD